jgi:hypothetical protein
MRGRSQCMDSEEISGHGSKQGECRGTKRKEEFDQCICVRYKRVSLGYRPRCTALDSQSNSLPAFPLRFPASRTARFALGQKGSPVIPTYTDAYPLSWSRMLAITVKMGVRAVKNMSGPGRMLARG